VVIHRDLVPALLGAGIGVGVLLVVASVIGPGPGASPPARRLPGSRGLRVGRLAAAVAAAVLTAALTGWPVGGALAALAVLAVPGLVAANAAHHSDAARTEAVAAWAEMLRDAMAAAAGIEEAIQATVAVAPEPIGPAVAGLVRRLDHERLPAALRAFADDLADPTADLVVTALCLAIERSARDLGELLGAVAVMARAEAALRLRVAASRSRVRTAVRVVLVFTGLFAAGLVAFNRAYVAPYDSAEGQLVLLVVGGAIAAALAQLTRLTRIPAPPRIAVPTGEGGPR
jgi:hypothetical protein